MLPRCLDHVAVNGARSRTHSRRSPILPRLTTRPRDAAGRADHPRYMQTDRFRRGSPPVCVRGEPGSSVPVRRDVVRIHGPTRSSLSRWKHVFCLTSSSAGVLQVGLADDRESVCAYRRRRRRRRRSLATLNGACTTAANPQGEVRRSSLPGSAWSSFSEEPPTRGWHPQQLQPNLDRAWPYRGITDLATGCDRTNRRFRGRLGSCVRLSAHLHGWNTSRGTRASQRDESPTRRIRQTSAARPRRARSACIVSRVVPYQQTWSDLPSTTTPASVIHGSRTPFVVRLRFVA